ncbi:MAG: tryptophan--tRNA ligase [Clostridia bacterium]|nr:tryptophan--tRNA ligase [Clostridia bacterium]
MLDQQQVVLSAVQPSGNLTVGNSLGAIKNFSAFPDARRFFCVADLHAVTVRQVPADLRRRTYETLALYLACGLDPSACVLFVQSQVPAHAELAWLLGCHTMFGELSRMTQFKDKSQKHADNINAGLFTYPVLMAADILLYQTDLVPVGADQKQHLELARNIAQRFNGVFGDTLTVPEGYIPPTGRKIMSLSDPTAKMSKSDPNPNASLFILDEPDVILRKCKRAVTDSGNEIRRGEGKEGIENLMTIYECCTGQSDEEVAALFDGRGYGVFKEAVGETVAEHLRPVREAFHRYMGDRAYLDECMKKGAEEAAYYARKTLSKVKRKMGFVG